MVRLAEPVASKAQFLRALYRAAVLPMGEPQNYDALADYCRELHQAGLRKVLAEEWGLDPQDTVIVCEIFREAGISLVLYPTV
ncbi:hypothetical protein C1Y63_09210 [Corynebacterium sp. 13CS0277]|nr:hypothetical protein C1Y63_09210 [Corynebacterium sp. 13CS0277]